MFSIHCLELRERVLKRSLTENTLHIGRNKNQQQCLALCFPNYKRPQHAILELGYGILEVTPSTDEEDGPFCRLYTDFFQEILIKNTIILSHIFETTNSAIYKMSALGHLAWLGDIQQLVQGVIVREFENIAKIRDLAKKLYDRMKNRTNFYSPEINQVLDFANDMFTSNDTARANQAISDFRAFPRVDKTPFKMCYEILEAFNQPFHGGKKDNSFFNMLALSQGILKEECPELFLNYDEDYGNVKLRLSLYVT